MTRNELPAVLFTSQRIGVALCVVALVIDDQTRNSNAIVRRSVAVVRQARAARRDLREPGRRGGPTAATSSADSAASAARAAQSADREQPTTAAHAASVGGSTVRRATACA